MLEVSFKKQMDNFSLDASFRLEKGILGILGPSGCGKSLTLQCIAGLQTPDQGSIVLHGRPLFDARTQTSVPSRLRKIGYVFQNYALFPHLTVAKNIAFGIQHLPTKERQQKVAEMMGKMHLNGYENHYPSQLSGGQQQRVALARTLITNPQLLLLDEPFSALDTHVKQLLEQELLEIIKTNYKGMVLLVTHNIEEAYRLCDQILIYSRGKTVQFGDKLEIMNQPASLTVARLTGCKNIWEVEIIGEEDGYYMIRSGTLVLRVKKCKKYNSPQLLAGIRSHDLSIISGKSLHPYSFPCDIVDTMEGISSINLLVKCQGHTFQMERSKDEFKKLQEIPQGSYQLYFSPDKIFLLEKE